jgi:hypothetical protein
MPYPVLNNSFSRTFHLIGRNLPSPRPRSRSPLYNRRDDRGTTPPRYQEYPSESRISHERGRAESPPSRSRGPDRLIRHDALVDLPQRRPRTASDTRDPDYSVKRRKTEDRAVNLSIVGRVPIGPDTYTAQETSTASTSPRSNGAMDDFSRMSGLSDFPFTLVSFARPRNFQDRGEENLSLHKVFVTRKHHPIKGDQ